MLLTAYTTLMQASTPLLKAYLNKRMRQGKEDPARAHERRGAPVRPRNAPLVWCHAASVGESLSLLSVIGRLLADHPDINVMVTTGTVTSANLMAQRLPARAFHQYIPVDHPQWVARFLDHWRPDMALWAESELWPNMLLALRRRRIPAVLLNARMSEQSFRRWRWARGAIGQMLSAFTLCLGQNTAEVERLRQLGAPRAEVSANLKYAAAPLPVDEARLGDLQSAVQQRPVVLWASTHAGEEEMALNVHKRLREKHPQLLTVIVPRHPVRGGDIAALAQAAGLPAQQRSANALPTMDDAVYIADTMGELGTFFRLTKNVVMGGSFADVGGHNPIEPAQLGCTVFFGPVGYNFITILDDFRSRRAVVEIKDQDDLTNKLDQALRDPSLFAPVGAAAKEITQEKAHIVDDLAVLLNPVIRDAIDSPKKGTAP